MLRRSALQLASEPTIDSAVAWGRTRLGPREQSKWLLPAEVASKSFIVISFMRVVRFLVAALARGLLPKYIASHNKKQRDQDQCYGNIWQTHFN